MKQKDLWLNRTLTTCAYYYRLCVRAEDYYAELRRIGVPEERWDAFLGPSSHAQTHHFEHDGKNIAIVTIGIDKAKKHLPVEIAALIVHEAVHIWQRHAAFIGSFNDHGDEEEAYAIQAISLQLMASYAEQCGL